MQVKLDERLPSLDGLRAASIAAVMITHAVTAGPELPALHVLDALFGGATGVRVFFVISGFLITVLLLRDVRPASGVLTDFYIRRALRIFPVYFAFILVLAALQGLGLLNLPFCNFLTALTFTKNLACGSWIDGHLWSLAVEEQFYLLWPAALLFLPRQKVGIALVALVLIAPVSRAIEYKLGGRVLTWPSSNFDGLMLGASLALLTARHGAAVARIAAFRPALGRGLALGCIILPNLLASRLLLGWFTVMFGPLLQAVSACYLIASLIHVRRGLSFRLLNSAPVARIGVLSYSIYIWQQLFLAPPAVYGLADRPLALTFPVNAVLAVAAAAASYGLLERPLLGLRKRFGSASG